MGHKRLEVIFLFLLYGFVIGLNAGCAVYPKSPPDDNELAPVRDTILEKAQKYTWERRYNKALELLDEAERVDGNSTELQLMRGHIFYTLECWAKARKAFNAVISDEPGNHHAVVRLWYLDAIEKGFREQDRDELKKRALEHLAKTPEDPEVVYAAVLGLEGAKAVYEKTKVIEQYSCIVESPDWREDLARIYFYDSLRKSGEDLLKRARFFRKEFPGSLFRYNMAGMALSILKKAGPDAVQSEVKEILNGEPKNRVLNYVCAKAILESNGDLEQASKCIRRSIKAAGKPDVADRYRFLDDKAWKRLMDQSRGEYYAVYARIKFLQEKTLKAMNLFKEGLSYDAHGYNLHLWYAEVLEKEGAYNEALKHFRVASELKDSVDSIKGMECILKNRGIAEAPADYFARIEGVSRFTDVTEEADLHGRKGNRVAWSDMDQDGFPDLVINGIHIFRNNCDGTFKDVTESSGVRHEYASGGILADFDNNGFPDLMAYTSKNGPRLYMNRAEQGGPIAMEDVTAESLPVWPFDDVPTEAAAAADVDGDGSIDIYLANFEKNHPERGMCASDLFYINLGNGFFADATSKIQYLSEEHMCGRGVSFADIDGDRRQDLFVANYRLDPDFLLVNSAGVEGQGSMLVDKADEYQVRGHNVLGAYGHSIGGTWGYLEKDRPSLFVASLAHPKLLGLSDISALYVPRSDGEAFESHFEDVGFRYQETHSDPSFVDVDLDGDLDLFITSVYRDAPSFLYLNQGGRFTDYTWLAGARVSNGWGAAWADYDRDGDMDLLVCAGNAPRLLRNEAQEFQRSWLEVKVSGNKSPGSGIGTKVMVETTDGSGLWLREIRAGRGTGNQDQALTHFGLGENRGPFKVTVQFPSGTDVVLHEIQRCNIINVEEP
ncbi:MAG: VCBS repeat-containing protein [Deltaproteobacteria bacterium]|nr:VCBS repeat-containing protein [Deltaproteobacteria bacterium]